MTGAANNTFYEVLDVRRDAKEADITAAYKRLLAEMRRDDAPPDPKRLAMAKVAHETLAHPGRRAEYDESIGVVAEEVRRKRPMLGLAALVFVAIGGGGAYYFLVHRPATPVVAAKPRTSASELAPEEVVRQVLPLLGRVEVALMSGEVRQA